MTGFLSAVLLALAGLAAMGVLGSRTVKIMPRLTEPTASYLDALDATAPARGTSPEPGSEEEQQALVRFLDLFRNYRAEELPRRVAQVYADDAFFRDGFKELQGAGEIGAYMRRGLEAVRECRFEFQSTVSEGGEHYVRWLMIVSLKRDAENVESRTLGISHVRFNRDGQVAFQQDYWDPTDFLYRRIPLANWMIAKVRERL